MEIQDSGGSETLEITHHAEVTFNQSDAILASTAPSTRFLPAAAVCFVPHAMYEEPGGTESQPSNISQLFHKVTPRTGANTWLARHLLHRHERFDSQHHIHVCTHVIPALGKWRQEDSLGLTSQPGSGLVLCAVNSDAEFCAPRTSCSLYMGIVLTYELKECFPIISDWIIKG